MQKLKPYFVCGTGRYQFDAGYIDLPDELLQELIMHLSSANQKAIDKQKVTKIQEPLNTQLMKELTGVETISGRDLCNDLACRNNVK